MTPNKLPPLPEWKQGLPDTEGVYAVCGYGIGARRSTAVVEVRLYADELYSNLHRENSDRDFEDWSAVADHSEKFFWARLCDLPPKPPIFTGKEFDL